MNYALHLNGISLLYADMGDIKKAVELNKRVRDIRDSLGGVEIIRNYIEALNNMASLYSELGLYEDVRIFNRGLFGLLRKKLR